MGALRHPLRCLLSFAFAFVMGGAGMQDTLLLCRMESALHRVCCCKHPQSTPRIATHDELSRRPCCDEVAWQSAAIPPSSSAAMAHVFVAPSLLEHRMPVATLLPNTARVDAARVAVDVREATGPPIPIKHRALLI